ncbi:type I-E CRISPR-associated protein Cas7/Cse4/CasC [Actinopolyspora mortivallis]|uniref:Type I-E CRISPR-associated protein Cas7/Cse4/CasC n=1 Tax=Actinopolyspora mortivallis TaxID=33906 RepID=A0A2T0H076_ACTMO|nr:type I-E CRISPR-associated protein Cas7/Cse4/CasC [Actinopolyspora mortivallis]PRW64772.1 type I-E CRISPR-associated protein Cas7/Cse4/CasC [Actinopolyspora mortivallis]
MNTAKYVDIHALHVLPFSNTNRDDLGAPKTVQFGGAERTRISSQSWKRPIRKHIERHLDEDTVRTRRVVIGVAERLEKHYGWDKDEAELAGIQVALSAGKGISLQQDKNDKEETVLTTNVLLLLPESGIDDLARLADQYRDDVLDAAQNVKTRIKMTAVLPSEQINEVLSRRSGTINLFGRMLAELPGANVDGAVQMAHAFTTHPTRVEYDFFTAVDDVEHNLGLTGSAHLNTGMFSAGTFYRYANVNLDDLLGNLDQDRELTSTLLTAFLRGFVHELPTGKQNPTAARTPPELVYIVVRDDRPVSLAGAFEAPVTGEEGHLVRSVSRLHTQAGALAALLGDNHILFSGHTATPATQSSPEQPAQRPNFGLPSTSFDELINDVVATACPGEHA